MFQTTNQYIYTYIHIYQAFSEGIPKNILKGLNQHHGMTFFNCPNWKLLDFHIQKVWFTGGYPQKKMGSHGSARKIGEL